MVNFRTEKISDRVTRIYAVCTELMYLVEGDEKAALLDTGSGFGSLRSVVDQLTDEPVIVLLTSRRRGLPSGWNDHVRRLR